MQQPLEIVFEHVDPSPAVEALVHKEAAKLERHFDRLTSCRVAIARPARTSAATPHDPVDVRLHITMPGQPDIVVSHNGKERPVHEDVQTVVRDAFATALRQLDDRRDKMKEKRA